MTKQRVTLAALRCEAKRVFGRGASVYEEIQWSDHDDLFDAGVGVGRCGVESATVIRCRSEVPQDARAELLKLLKAMSPVVPPQKKVRTA